MTDARRGRPPIPDSAARGPGGARPGAGRPLGRREPRAEPAEVRAALLALCPAVSDPGAELRRLAAELRGGGRAADAALVQQQAEAHPEPSARRLGREIGAVLGRSATSVERALRVGLSRRVLGAWVDGAKDSR